MRSWRPRSERKQLLLTNNKQAGSRTVAAEVRRCLRELERAPLAPRTKDGIEHAGLVASRIGAARAPGWRSITGTARRKRSAVWSASASLVPPAEAYISDWS